MAEPQQPQDPESIHPQGKSDSLAESVRRQLSELEDRVTHIMNDEKQSPIQRQEAKVIKAAFSQLWRSWKPADDSIAMIVLLAFNLGRQVQHLDSLRNLD